MQYVCHIKSRKQLTDVRTSKLQQILCSIHTYRLTILSRKSKRCQQWKYILRLQPKYLDAVGIEPYRMKNAVQDAVHVGSCRYFLRTSTIRERRREGMQNPTITLTTQSDAIG